MLRQFVRDSAIYGVSSLLSRGIALLLLPFYTRVLAPSDYGIIDILTVLTTLVNVTIALEISQGLARHFPEARRRSEQIAYASTALWFTVGVYTLFAAIALASAPALAQWILESGERTAVFRAAVLSMWANGIFLLVLNQLRWRLQPKLYAITNVAFTLVSIGLTVVMVLVVKIGVIGVFLGQFVGGIGGAALALYFARQSYRPVFDWGKCKEMLRFSVPLVPSSAGVFVTLYVDRIAVKELLSLADLGLFGVGYRIASIIGLVMVGFQTSLTPLIYTHYRNPDTPHELARIFRSFVAFALLTMLALAMLSREIIMFLTTPEYYHAYMVVPLLAPAMLLSGMYIFAPGLNISKRTAMMAAINIASAILNTVLNIALIPVLSIRGAALATLLSTAATFSAYMMYSQKLYFVPHSWGRLGASVLVAVGIFLIGSQFNLSLWEDIIIKLTMICLAAAMFVLLGLVDTVEIQRVWKRLRPLIIGRL